MFSTVFEKARTYLYRHARPLDLARFQYHFEQGSREAVMQVLSCYQNADGGLGHAVEADCWNPNSTPLHTATACGIIGEIAYPDAAHPVQSEFFEEHRKTAERECEFLLNSQLNDDSWPIPWQWDEYPEEWAVSRNWWKGHVIVENLRYLKGLHRI